MPNINILAVLVAAPSSFSVKCDETRRGIIEVMSDA